MKARRTWAETAARLEPAGLALWGEPRGGLFLWAELPPGLDAAEVSRLAMRAGVVLAPGDAFSIGRIAGRFLRFNAAQCAAPRVFEVLERAMRDAAASRSIRVVEDHPQRVAPA